MNYDKKVQLLIIGDSTVGKTSILSRYTNNDFNPHYLATVGLDFFKKDEVFNGKTVRIKIWDTAGQERYKSLTQGYFRNAEGIMIVYDVSNLVSFENLKYWIQSIKTHINIDKGEVPAIIIGNKIDIFEREVKKEDAEKFAKDEGFQYFETSAKNGKGVNESIKYLVKTILRNMDDKEGTNNIKNENGFFLTQGNNIRNVKDIDNVNENEKNGETEKIEVNEEENS